MALMFRSVLQNAGGAAELIVTCDSEFAGATISCSDGTTTLNKTCPSSSPYEVTFKIPNSGDWTISATVSGTAYTSDPISVELDYTALLEYGFNWRRWVDTARFLDSTDYNSLEEVLADEKALRQLFLVHDCVDYLAEATSANADIQTIINTDLAAKWINLSDYALDTLYANTIIKGYMDTADKYGYGEWVITDNTTTPPTWGAKGNVPVMTSTSAPYGTVAYSSYHNYSPWNISPWAVFTGDGQWLPSNGATNNYIQYTFANPICPKKVSIMTLPPKSNAGLSAFKIQGSNDGTNFVDLGSFSGTELSSEEQFFDLENDDYYVTLRLFHPSAMLSDSIVRGIEKLQFYGRELSVSVPTMTGETMPYGRVIHSSAQNGNINGYTINGYGAFDNSDLSAWANASTDNVRRCGYDFGKPVFVKFARKAGVANWYYINTYKIQASDDGNTWVDISGSESADIVTLNPDKPYRYWALQCLTGGTNNVFTLIALNFYGKDYSEKEFEQGTNKKWLYDHGVELDLESANYGQSRFTQHEPTRNSNSMSFDCPAGDHVSMAGTNSTINLSQYSLVRGVIKNRITPTNVGIAILNAKIIVNDSTTVSDVNMADGQWQYGLDISAVNQSYYVCVRGCGQTYSGAKAQAFDLIELWLE